MRRLTMVEGAPFGRPAFFCGVVAALDGGRLPPWAGVGCRGTVVIMASSLQDGQTAHSLLYYSK